jgi:hypothetical protein
MNRNNQSPHATVKDKRRNTLDKKRKKSKKKKQDG